LLHLAQTLQDTFPDHGYDALLTGRSQCAQMQYDLCAKTLEMLVSRNPATEFLSYLRTIV